MLQAPTVVSILAVLVVASYSIRTCHRYYMPIHTPFTATKRCRRSDLVIDLQLYLYRHARHGRHDLRNRLYPILDLIHILIWHRPDHSSQMAAGTYKLESARPFQRKEMDRRLDHLHSCSWPCCFLGLGLLLLFLRT